MNSHAVLKEIGVRMRRERLNQNLTQETLAQRAGVSRRVILDLEKGKGCGLSSFIEILRSLKKLDQLDAFLPDPGISPLQLAKLRGHERQRASGRRTKGKE
ncbi:MAG: transcriptional regulator [Deltaproteobacteria bacterium]|nr:MAG: transcriptional regulator [Deltaproteobacteria bacterium]RLC14963.1 MAG: transcriptional regulator [Deltaproteobacteria bacterium]